jgi:hypothetical protein
MKRLLPLVAALLVLALLPACDDDKDGALRWHSNDSSSSSKTNNDLLGTWSLSDGSSTWYIHFSDNATWYISDDQEGSASRVHGTYTFDGNHFSGPMVNPGVGTGSIAGNIDGDLISLDFVEDWHLPSKHVAYTGERL